MNFDFKVTSWESVTVPDDYAALVFAGITAGDITNTCDIFDFLDELDEIEAKGSVVNHILGLEEQISVLDNGGAATIEIFDEGEMIWSNIEEFTFLPQS
jgi:hypothetical protein